MKSANTGPILSRNALSWILGVPRIELEEVASRPGYYYHPFPIERPGKRPRWIDNPSKTLKNIQRLINLKVLANFPFPDYVQGGVKGRSSRSNAKQHLGGRLVVRFDIENFFPSVTNHQVYSAWVRRFGCTPSVAGLLTALTTYRGHLPQGAPTSSSLANLVLLSVDLEIYSSAVEAGCTYTRYVDDLVVSGEHPEGLIGTVISSLKRAGFEISRPKLNLQHSSQRQEVTGLTVNSAIGPSVSRSKRDRVRASIQQLRELPRGESLHLASSVRGRIAHLMETNPGTGLKLLRLLDKVVTTEDALEQDSSEA